MVEHLETFPRLGRMVPEYQTGDIREIIVRKYRVIYRIRKQFIEILTITHGSRKLI